MKQLIKEMEFSLVLFAIGGLLSLLFVEAGSSGTLTFNITFAATCALWLYASAIVIRSFVVAAVESIRG